LNNLNVESLRERRSHQLGSEQSDHSAAASFEPHYSVQVLAELWRLDESTIRRIFETAPGVLRLGKTDKRRSGKREYFTLRIPASVAEREYQRRLVAAAERKGV
jgi:hypothetical protein